jgi:hypothetical protein
MEKTGYVLIFVIHDLPLFVLLGAPKIIFASRTHSQLSQAIQELKRTAYSQCDIC